MTDRTARSAGLIGGARREPDHRRALACFDTGVLALGLVLGEEPPDAQRALVAFTRATDAEPTMGDAWLGRLAAGDRAGATLHALYLQRASIGAQQRRVGLPRGALVGFAPVGLFIDYPLSNPEQVAAAYASSLITGGDFEGAERVLEPLAADPLVRFVRGVGKLQAGDWTATLTELRGRSEWPDPMLTSAADYVAGSACIQSGLLNEGIRLLSAARDSDLDNCRAAATFAIGMALRTQGHESDAVRAFEEAIALDPTLTDAARARSDASYRLLIDTPGHPNKPDALAEEASTAEAEAELAAQIGLVAVKDQVERLRSTARLAAVRAAKGLRTNSRSLHLAFTGPPGTGKTTVARIVASLYRGLGILHTDTVIEVSRRDLVGEHLGSTAPKTSMVIDRALDGVLLIDEAYTLIQDGLSGGDAFGREALDTLLARMENDRDRLVVIIAGYDDEIDRLLAANEGLASRFARRIRFDSYSPSELVAIAESMAAGRDSRIEPQALDLLGNSFTSLCGQTVSTPGGPRLAIDVAGNGRHVRNLIEASEEEREHRLARAGDLDELSSADLMTLTAADVRAALARLAPAG